MRWRYTADRGYVMVCAGIPHYRIFCFFLFLWIVGEIGSVNGYLKSRIMDPRYGKNNIFAR